MLSINSLIVFSLPILASVAFQTAADTSGDIAGVIRNLLNLGAGGLVAVVFYYRWQHAEKKREEAEARFTNLLLRLAKIERVDSDRDSSHGI